MLSVKVISAIIQWKLRVYQEISIQPVCRKNVLREHGQVISRRMLQCPQATWLG